MNQTYQDFEIIILDDCSTDNSRDIIEKYRENKKVSAVIYNETNSGSTFRQWKKGIGNAKGEYIWIAESDDYAEKLFLEKTVALMDKYTTDVVFTDSVIIDENGNKLPDLTRRDLSVIKNEKCFDGNYFVSRYFTRGCTIYNASMTLFRKEKSLKIRGYGNFRSCGDWYFWGNMILGSSVVFCNEKLKAAGDIIHEVFKNNSQIDARHEFVIIKKVENRIKKIKDMSVLLKNKIVEIK